ncbi:MAG: DUF2147 domain-containing protein [Tenacibaculum sp.]
MKELILTGILCIFAINCYTQSIFGRWENRDEQTNNVDSVIEVYQKNGKAYAKIVDIIDKKNRNALCHKCSGERKNKAILGMEILSGLKKDGKRWSGGKILDPKIGKEYDCYIELKNKNKLKIRGYAGFSFLGRTVYWYKKQ